MRVPGSSSPGEDGATDRDVGERVARAACRRSEARGLVCRAPEVDPDQRAVRETNEPLVADRGRDGLDSFQPPEARVDASGGAAGQGGSEEGGAECGPDQHLKPMSCAISFARSRKVSKRASACTIGNSARCAACLRASASAASERSVRAKKRS